MGRRRKHDWTPVLRAHRKHGGPTEDFHWEETYEDYKTAESARSSWHYFVRCEKEITTDDYTTSVESLPNGQAMLQIYPLGRDKPEAAPRVALVCPECRGQAYWIPGVMPFCTNDGCVYHKAHEESLCSRCGIDTYADRPFGCLTCGASFHPRMYFGSSDECPNCGSPELMVPADVEGLDPGRTVGSPAPGAST